MVKSGSSISAGSFSHLLGDLRLITWPLCASLSSVQRGQYRYPPHRLAVRMNELTDVKHLSQRCCDMMITVPTIAGDDN